MRYVKGIFADMPYVITKGIPHSPKETLINTKFFLQDNALPILGITISIIGLIGVI